MATRPPRFGIPGEQKISGGSRQDGRASGRVRSRVRVFRSYSWATSQEGLRSRFHLHGLRTGAKVSPPVLIRPSSVLCSEAPPLHVAPEFLGHLSGANRYGTEHRFEGVCATLKADRIPSERRLLAPCSLRHL